MKAMGRPFVQWKHSGHFEQEMLVRDERNDGFGWIAAPASQRHCYSRNLGIIEYPLAIWRRYRLAAFGHTNPPFTGHVSGGDIEHLDSWGIRSRRGNTDHNHPCANNYGCRISIL